MIKTWLIDIDKKTDNKFVIFQQINGTLNFCAYDNEKRTHEMISELREDVLLSAVGCELGNDTDNEKDFSIIKLENVC